MPSRPRHGLGVEYGARVLARGRTDLPSDTPCLLNERSEAIFSVLVSFSYATKYGNAGAHKTYTGTLLKHTVAKSPSEAVIKVAQDCNGRKHQDNIHSIQVVECVPLDDKAPIARHELRECLKRNYPHISASPFLLTRESLLRALQAYMSHERQRLGTGQADRRYFNASDLDTILTHVEATRPTVLPYDSIFTCEDMFIPDIDAYIAQDKLRKRTINSVDLYTFNKQYEASLLRTSLLPSSSKHNKSVVSDAALMATVQEWGTRTHNDKSHYFPEPIPHGRHQS